MLNIRRIAAGFAIAGLLMAGLFCATAGAEALPKLGTGLKWEKSAEAAFAKAKADGKLVMFMHLSGNFDKDSET